MGGDKVYIPPFKTQGIKSKLVPLIKDHVCINDSTVWIEPFMGSAQMVAEFLTKQGALLSEKDDAHYYLVRERFNKDHDPLDFLFLNRSCFNGMIRFNKNNEFNVPYGHKPQRFAKAYVTKIVNQVRNFERKIAENDWTFLCHIGQTNISA